METVVLLVSEKHCLDLTGRQTGRQTDRLTDWLSLLFLMNNLHIHFIGYILPKLIGLNKEQLANADNFKIFNSLGEIVKIQTAQYSQSNRIDLQDQSVGTYYILLFDSSGRKLDQGQFIKIK